MSTPFVFIENSLISIPGNVINLNADESFHLTRVLRIRKGNTVICTDGCGYSVECEVLEAGSKSTMLRVSGEICRTLPKPYAVHIAIAPPKHPDRLEWFVEKAVETGIDKITLMVCEHSEKWNVKLPRLQRIMIAAMKQSQQTSLPSLIGPVDFNEVVQSNSDEEKFIGYCDGITETLVSKAQPHKKILVAIGPEGDFSPAEVQTAVNHGFYPISLGATRLRTETAGLVACLAIHLINDLKI